MTTAAPAMTPLRVNAERVVLFGWSRAILLQLAHPLVAAGVAEHSTFRGGPFAAARRLHETVHAMLALTFGPPEVRDAAIAGILTIHRRVHGRLRADVGPYPAGTPYSAEDPALVRWVHLTLLDSVIRAADLLVSPMDEAARDTYCREAAWVALALGARAADIPTRWADVHAAVERACASPDICVGPDARTLAPAVLAPRGVLAAAAAPAARLNRRLTLGWLPASVRAGYGFDWTDRDARRFDRTVRIVRAVRRWTPDRLALWPEARQAPADRAADPA
ncbi:MAG: oxygenase MpaB family protein [Vicinamibacterales bacterium]